MTIPDAPAASPLKPDRRDLAGRRLVYRHSAVTRVAHWINLLCLIVLLMSGLQILNAHPALYWGAYGADADPSVISFGAAQTPAGGLRGVSQVGPLKFDTTGVLGLSKLQGQWAVRGFPGWATLPSWQDLATGRRWHFFFAWLFVINGAVYWIASLWSRHVQRDLLPRLGELKPRHVLADIRAHVLLSLPRGEAARQYNTLQKLSYLFVLALLLPAMVVTGLTMSPAMNAVAPWLLTLLGGRQSARTLHFLSADLIVLFVLVHVAWVVLAGPINEMRSMLTGWYALKSERTPRRGLPEPEA